MAAGTDIQAVNNGFLAYHEPTIVEILILISFFLFLAFGEWASDKIFRAGLIGQIIVGAIYGTPLGNILPLAWQEAFIALGYIGLVLLIFEGALAVRLDLLRKTFFRSLFASAIGILASFGLSYAVCVRGFGYGAIETFIIGGGLAITSLGTSFVLIQKTSTHINFADTKVGATLVGASVFDDIAGLIMAGIITRLGEVGELGEDGFNMGWLIGRPIVAALAMGILTPIVCKFIFAPFFRYYLEDIWPLYKHTANIFLMVLMLSAFLSIGAFASGVSGLFGSFLAGTFISALPDRHPDGCFVVPTREEGEKAEDKTPTFLHTFEKFFLGAQQYVLVPIFFASVGFAIPVKNMWSWRAVWHGGAYTALMLLSKLLVGLIIPIWDIITKRKGDKKRNLADAVWPSLWLGSAMVARGEIGLLIIQIGFNNTKYLGEEAFITAIWAILLNTIIGPTCVGIITKVRYRQIGDGGWGLTPPPPFDLLPRHRSRSRSRRNSVAASTFSNATMRTDLGLPADPDLDAKQPSHSQRASRDQPSTRGRQRAPLSPTDPLAPPAPHPPFRPEPASSPGTPGSPSQAEISFADISYSSADLNLAQPSAGSHPNISFASAPLPHASASQLTIPFASAPEMSARPLSPELSARFLTPAEPSPAPSQSPKPSLQAAPAPSQPQTPLLQAAESAPGLSTAAAATSAAPPEMASKTSFSLAATSGAPPEMASKTSTSLALLGASKSSLAVGPDEEWSASRRPSIAFAAPPAKPGERG